MSINRRGLVSLASALALGAAVSGGAWAQGGSGASASGSNKPAESAHHATTSARKQHASARVEAVQRALNQHGAKLKVDGQIGPTTREALKKFQADNGLKASGHVNKATLDKLGVK